MISIPYLGTRYQKAYLWRESQTQLKRHWLGLRDGKQTPNLQMKKLGSRDYGISVTYCCVTNHLKTEWFKPQIFHCSGFCGLGLCIELSSTVSGLVCVVSAIGQTGASLTLGASRLTAGCLLSRIAWTLLDGLGWQESTGLGPRTGTELLLSPSLCPSQFQGQPRFKRRRIDSIFS